MRRLLLNPYASFYHWYPNTCIFLIEEVYKDIVGTAFSFNISRDRVANDQIYINYIDEYGKVAQKWTPLKEVKGWYLPEKCIDFHTAKVFHGTSSERDLFKIYGWPKITIKSRILDPVPARSQH